MADDEDKTDAGGSTEGAPGFPKLGRQSAAGIGLAGVVAIASIFALQAPETEQESAQPALLPASEERVERPAIPQNKPGDVDFIVRFEDLPAIEECVSTFRSDPEHARSLFQEWARDHPGLAGFRLKKTNYSGELVLTWSGEGGPPERDQIMDVREKLQAMAAVKYADPDFSTRIE